MTVARFIQMNRLITEKEEIPLLGKVEFTYEYLERMEIVLQKIPGDEAKKLEFQICSMFGFILGETMVRNFPGSKWVNLESENLWDMMVQCGAKYPECKGIIAQPMVRISKFLKNPEDRPLCLYFMAEMTSKYTVPEMMAQGEHIGDGWYQYPNGFIMRMLRQEVGDMKDKEVDELLKKGVPKDAKPVTLEDGKLIEHPLQSKYSPTEREKRKHWN